MTDDFPCFIIPGHNKTIAGKALVPVTQSIQTVLFQCQSSTKEEYAAYTIRPKINCLLPDYLRPLKEEKIKLKSLDLRSA